MRSGRLKMYSENSDFYRQPLSLIALTSREARP